jgi:thioredoxin 1
MAVTVLCFSQEGCMGCVEQEPINREVEVALGLTIQEIDAVKNPHFIKEYGLRVTPTVLVVSDGQVKERFEGVVHREELEGAIRKYL